ncbi:MAG: LysR family transcriptional regulator [Burkholderiales bacterium]|nr:LysR family transcriptional regulator [Burkholderiales bacterium]
MRLSLDALATLDAIARRGSFAAAAEELNRVPSAVTYAVQKLEQDLGVPLFDRSGHRAKLTPAGAELLREGRHLLRSAAEIERRVQRLAEGWETELAIAVDDILPLERIYPLVGRFYALNPGTRLRVGSEVLAGTWDALLSGRADLVIGASGDPPSEGGCSLKPMGTAAFDFVVAPTHPLAAAPEPLAPEAILHHRAILVADSSRTLPSRTTGLISGQDCLTVPSMQAKIDAHVAGLGVGYLPVHRARPLVAAGTLVVKSVQESKPTAQLYVAARPRGAGKALKWFLAQLEDPATLRALLA